MCAPREHRVRISVKKKHRNNVKQEQKQDFPTNYLETLRALIYNTLTNSNNGTALFTQQLSTMTV